MKKNSIIILGCGSSSGVPTIETGWGNCNPNNIKNYRSRASIIININGFNILIDTSPDLRLQALNNNIKKIDCILYTHEHSDHIAGVDDIRSFNRLANKPLDCYLNQKTYTRIKSLFNYAFKELEINQNRGYYRPVLIPHIIKNNDVINLNNNTISVKAIEHLHGSTNTLGYIFNNKFAYITDILDFPNQESLNQYKDLDLIIMSACTIREHKSHMTIDKVIEILVNQLKPKKAYLSHMAEGIDYDIYTKILKQKGIKNIHLSYDGLQIKI